MLLHRMASPLKWKEEDILELIVKRLFRSKELLELFGVDHDRLNATHGYREECFYKVFPKQVHRGPNKLNAGSRPQPKSVLDKPLYKMRHYSHIIEVRL